MAKAKDNEISAMDATLKSYGFAPVMGTADVVRATGLSPHTIRRRIAEGELSCRYSKSQKRRLGRLMFSRMEVARFIAALP